jgi:quercetin dioxygenase-like cupin family protein
MWKDLRTLILSEILPISDKAAITAPEATRVLAEAIPAELSRRDIEKFSDFLATLPQYSGETFHHFGDKVYVREYRMKADTVVIGKIHARDHVFVVVAGDVTATIDSGAMQRVQAPYTVTAPAGIKRMVIAHTDAVILNVHGNEDNTRDLAVLEKRLTVPEDGSVIDLTLD